MGNKESVKEEQTDLYHYKTENGGIVNIKRQMNPYKELQILNTASPQETKNAFRAKATSPSRQDRAMASLAYYMITSKSRQCFKKMGDQFIITNEDIFLLTAIGYTSKIIEMIGKDEGLINARNEYNHIPLYLAARAGFYDLTKILITRGSIYNHQQIHGSTTLHAAAYYSQTEIVQLLLESGVDPTIKNQWNHAPGDETDVEEIQQIFKVYKEDAVSKLVDSLAKKNKPNRLRPVFYGNDTVAKEVIVNEDDLPDNWIMAWHGTDYKHLESIVEYGLQPSGSTLPDGRAISIQPHHIKLNITCFGIEDWARAIFVSPSLRYAAHPAYAKKIFSEKLRWNVVVKVYLSPSVAYKSYDPTALPKHESLSGEPQAPEYRIQSTKDDVILRIESNHSEEDKPLLIVKSIVFIKTDFLENVTEEREQIPYADIQDIFS